MNTSTIGGDRAATVEELRKSVREAFAQFKGVNLDHHGEARARVVAILDAVEEDLVEKMENCNCFDDVARSYGDRDDLLECFATKEAAFDAALMAYTFNPFRPDSKDESWSDSCDYFAFDGYGHLVGIRYRADLACWYEYNIDDYLIGNYGELDEDALEALAEVFADEEA